MSLQSNIAISIEALEKTYRISNDRITVLKDINLQISQASFVVIKGPSGSGKTTLLNLISGIDKPSKGKIFVAGVDLTIQDEDSLSDFRCLHVGFVFQAYNLVSTLTVAENIAFPMEWMRKSSNETESKVKELLGMVGLENRANHFPAQLSGGEQQRVAFARALSNDPDLILADEPTGNLDVKNAEKIIQVLQLLKTRGKTIVVSTHDMQIEQLADQIFCLDEGKLANSDG